MAATSRLAGARRLRLQTFRVSLAADAPILGT
jgi:hypothetical protein